MGVNPTSEVPVSAESFRAASVSVRGIVSVTVTRVGGFCLSQGGGRLTGSGMGVWLSQRKCR